MDQKKVLELTRICQGCRRFKTFLLHSGFWQNICRWSVPLAERLQQMGRGREKSYLYLCSLLLFEDVGPNIHHKYLSRRDINFCHSVTAVVVDENWPNMSKTEQAFEITLWVSILMLSHWALRGESPQEIVFIFPFEEGDGKNVNRTEMP